MIERFGAYTFDAGRRQVVHDHGHLLHLTPKAFDLLAVLLENAPRVVRKTDLHQGLWPGTFVSDATLVGLVKELRRVLHDHDPGSPLIRTSHGVGYAFCGALEKPQASSIATAPPSIAVLAFENLSADPENEYFSDGLTEELIHALTQLPGLRVASRTSSFQFRGKNVDVKEIGRQLNVDQVLEGSVRRAGQKLRIVAQLVNVADGYHLWSERYDRESVQGFEIHDEVTASIVKALEPTLTRRPPSVVRRHRTM